MMHVKPRSGGGWHNDVDRLARSLHNLGFFKHLKMHYGGVL